MFFLIVAEKAIIFITQCFPINVKENVTRRIAQVDKNLNPNFDPRIFLRKSFSLSQHLKETI